MRLTVPKAPYIEAYSGLPVATEPGHPISGSVCSPASHCPGTIPGNAPAENGNTAAYLQESTGLSNWTVNPTNKLTKAWVSITQEQGPTISFDTADPTVHNPATGEDTANVLYGGGSWLGPHSGAFEVRANDTGLGLKTYHAAVWGWSDYKEYYGEGACAGVQCPQHNGPYPGYYQGYTYSAGMSDGEPEFEAFTEDMVGVQAWVTPLQKIKVDGTPPHEITVSGFQNGSELPLGETTLKIKAKDGSGTTKSSGIKSIKLSIDGKEVPGTAASCSLGPCSATTEATLAARNYSNGEHSLIVSAMDNANNLAQEEFSFWVHGASPVSVGPGTVDPNTGQFTLSATDVAPGGGIGLSRTYESRDVPTGAEGPLGPQWALNLGGDERLTVPVGGDAILSATGGADTTFLSKGKGEFESPPGDGNLKLEGKEAVPGKGITEYLLKDEKAGTKTKFEKPSGLQSSTPTFEDQFGEEPSQLSHPLSIAVDPSGNLWTTNAQSNLIEKYSPTGALLAAYGSYGSGEKQFSLPWGVAIDPRNGNVYVSDQGNFRIQELSSTGAFIKMFGWGVKDGHAEVESCTEKCRSGLAGTGNAQFSYLAGLAVDPSGNLWVADYGNNRLQELNEKAEFVRKFGSTGSGEAQFNGPLDIALSGGNLYITDYGNNRVQEFSSTGTPIARFSECTGGPGSFTNPYGIATEPSSGNLYIVDQGHSRVQECSAAHAFITKFGSAGSGPGQLSLASGAAVGASGEIYALDNSTNRIEQWARSTWVPIEAGGPLSEAGGPMPATTTFAYTTVEREGKPQIEPTEALSPVPVGVSCGTKASELKRGCRALTFTYAEHKTAKGENESEWGDYEGNLSRVYYHAWDPSKAEMTETAVAQYSYDNKGRLRAEWDPRISPSLKTRYGYDYEGHLTSVAQPGQEPWIFTYGSIFGDPSPGRLLKLARPAATTPLWGGNLPANEEAPKVTGSFVVGVTLGLSTGKWSNSPVSYGYQWEDCNSGGGECAPIPGATNANYTLVGSDVGHVVEAVVTATNAGGSRLGGTVGGHLVTATGTKVEGEHRAPEPGTTIEYGVPVSGSKAPYALGATEAKAWGQETDLPAEGVAIFPPDEPMGWPAATYKRATVHYFDKDGRMVNTALPTGGIATTEYNPFNDVVRTLSPDNRAAALTEAGKTTEVSKLLDTKSEYNGLGNELLQTRGPQYTVKLASGATVQAREHVRYFYDEGAPSGQSFGLVTKKTDGAEYEDKEADVRTTLTSYSGQEGLGWTLRKPTSTTTDPAGLDLVSKTIYDKNTGNVIETRSPGGNAETIYPPAFASPIGSLGSGNGQFKEPCGIAIDSASNLWVVDAANGRIQKLSSSGTFLVAYGTKGSGNLQFQRPFGIAINPSTGNIYVGDYGNNRVEELSSSGAYVTSFGTTGPGALLEPMGVAIDASGNVWVADRGHNRVVEFSAEGTYIRAVGTAGSGNGQLSAPVGLAISEGSLFVVDSGNSRVEQFSLTGEYLGQFGSKGSGTGQLKEPFGLGVNTSTGNLYVADPGNQRVDEFSPAGRYLTQWETWGPAHQLSNPIALAVGAAGKLYLSDVSAGKLSTWTPPEAGSARLNFASNIGSSGSGNGQFSTPIDIAFDGEGNIWASDAGNNRIEKFSSKGSWAASYGSLGSGNEQFNAPGGIDVNQSTGNVYIADTKNARVVERSSTGAFIRKFGTEGSGKLTQPGSLKIDSAGNVWVPDMSTNKIFDFSSTGAFIVAYGKEGSGAGEVAFKKPIALALVGENVYVADSANHRVLEMTNKGAFVREFAKEGSGSGELYDPEGIAADGAGNIYVVDQVAAHVEEFSSSGVYKATYPKEGGAGSGEGQLKGPIGDAIDAAGNLYVADSGNNRLEKWSYANPAVSYTKSIYYSAGSNGEYPSCGNHPEWANTPCETLPAAQPNTPGISNLPVESVTYSIWGVPETITEAFGSTTRTKKETFDAAGRALTSEVASSSDTPLPKVTNEYNSSTGALEKQSTTTEEKTKTITSIANRLGQFEKYTDADGVTSTYKYDEDGRPSEVNYGEVDGASASQIYAYDPTTGALSSLYDTTAGTFTAKYDAEGKLSSETYPNGMKASYTRSSVGESTGIEYVKTTHCTSGCTWFSGTITPAIHGETMKQTSSLAEEPSYTYDAVGHLTAVQEVPSGKGCTTRLYSYDEEGDRTSATTREPGLGGACASEGGTREAHIYDAAGRLADAGVSYDAFGNLTALPASDAGGHELNSTYYVDNQLASQEQQEEGKAKIINLKYDPAGRARETLVTSKPAAISHYAGGGEALTWTTEGASIWTRNIPGIDGSLCATQASGQAPVLQLHDLQGNIVATAALSETETKLLSTYNSTEFGVPQSGGGTPKYSWLGASGLKSELPSSGIITTGEGSYVPEIGRSLQSEPVASPGAFPNGAAGVGVVQATYLDAAAEQFKAIALEQEAAYEVAARREAEENAFWEECPASECHVDGPGEGNCEVNCVEEVEDPSVLLTVTESFAVAAVLREGKNIAEALSHLKIPALAAQLINALASLAEPALSGLALGLETCYGALKGSTPGAGKCKLWLNLAFNWPPVEAGVEICWKKEEWRKNKKRLTYPYCRSEYGWPA